MAAIAKSGIAKDRVLVQSFFPTSLETVKRLDPALRTQFLTSSGTGQTAAQNLAYVVARGHDVLAPDDTAPDLRPELVQAAHAAGKEVLLYTPDSRTAMQAALAKGADGLITDRPACLLRLLGRPVPRGLTGGAGEVRERADDVGPDGPARRRRRAARCARPAGPRPPAPTTRRGDLRVVGLQYKQDVDNVTTYDAFRTAMRCLVEDHVVPLRDGRPVLAVFNEDIGLMTLVTGTRGAAARAQAASPLRAPAPGVAPVGAAAALGEMNAAYAPQVAAYQALLRAGRPAQAGAAGGHGHLRACLQHDLQRHRPRLRHLRRRRQQPGAPPQHAPTRPRSGCSPTPTCPHRRRRTSRSTDASRTSPTSGGPPTWTRRHPRGERNLLHRNEKVPLTQVELDLLALDAGPVTGPEAVANVRGPRLASHRLGIATSLPAFVYGYPFGARPEGFLPCEDLAKTYMLCMDAQGVDLVVQDEANPGPWAAYNPGGWQPLEWMSSTWRAVADPSVPFRYNVTPHLVGNLLDLPFDGQSAITVRGGGRPARSYVGTTEPLDPRDPPEYAVYAGRKPHFLALAPWVVPDAPRPQLQDVSARLAGGSGDPLEDQYLQTAVHADLLPTPAPVTHQDPLTQPARDRLPATGGDPPYAALLLLLLVVILRRTPRWT